MKINQLTPEQEALIPVYQQKWRKIAESTEPLNRRKARKAVKAAYKLIGRKEPKLIFVKSPASAWKYLMNCSISLLETEKIVTRDLKKKLTVRLLREIEYILSELFYKYVSKYLAFLRLESVEIAIEIRESFSREIWKKFFYKVLDIELQISPFFSAEGIPLLGSEDLVSDGSFINYCISVLNCKYDLKIWNIYQQLIQHTGWIFPFEKTCLICDRPTHLSFDSEQRLHAEGKPAIAYADGFSIYSYHGVTLPEKYGKVHPQQWEAKWLLEEENAELRRVLIEGIGYPRICQELQAIEFHTWQGYTVLRILDRRADIEPIYLLKMTCPSTGHIHALRIPPTIRSAREAIRWVNWGVDPEDFQVQT